MPRPPTTQRALRCCHHHSTSDSTAWRTAHVRPAVLCYLRSRASRFLTRPLTNVVWRARLKMSPTCRTASACTAGERHGTRTAWHGTVHMTQQQSLIVFGSECRPQRRALCGHGWAVSAATVPQHRQGARVPRAPCQGAPCKWPAGVTGLVWSIPITCVIEDPGFDQSLTRIQVAVRT